MGNTIYSNCRVMSLNQYIVTETYPEHVNNVETSRRSGGQAYAKGIDLVPRNNNHVYQECEIIAHSDGTVIYASNGLGGYGNVVIIHHKNGYCTAYGHLKTICVKANQKVSKGNVLGVIGNTGNSYGIHLHFEVRKYPKEMTSAIFNSNIWGGFDWVDPTNYVDSDLPGMSTNIVLKASATVKSNYRIGNVDYSPIFDANYYLSKYADLKKAFGNDTEKAWKHFCSYGMKEHRQGNDRFNVDTYKNNYVDLRNAFGNDIEKYYKHFCEFGIKENRTAIASTVSAKKVLTATSYPNYTDGRVYRVRKSYNDDKSSLGSWSGWTGAFNKWNANKSTHHVYDANGNQLD